MKHEPTESPRWASVLGHVATHERATARWLQRLAPLWQCQALATMSREETKLYFTRLVLPLLGGLCHLVLVGVFLMLDLPTMALVNVISLGVFAAAALVVRSGRHRLGTRLALLEASVHVPVATVLLGLDAGYLVFNFIVAMAASVAYGRKERWESFGFIVYAFVSSVLLTVYCHGHAPVLSMPPKGLVTVASLISVATFVALVSGVSHFVRVSDQAEARVEAELRRSDQLLLNVLPAQVAARLKASPTTIADSFPVATVLFADIVGFTKLASQRPGAEIVAMLNEVFSTFDRIAEAHGLEKIKTIGDAYMVVGGVPNPSPDHAVSIVRMALAMRDALARSPVQVRTPIDVRIGIHSGPVVAGVIGERKFAYDLWGDTVNTASRMESHGVPGGIQVSDQTARLVDGLFELEDRGEIAVKGKGNVRTWLVKGLKSQSEGTKGAA